MFGGTKTKEPTIAQEQRLLDREYRKLEENEKKLEMEIRRAAGKNQNDICRILAKELIEIRKQKSRMQSTKSKLTAIHYQSKHMNTSVTLAKTMGNTANIMKQMNQTVKPEAIASTMRDFQKATMTMEMTEEMINDTFDDMFDSGESKAIMDSVLDEIGIEMSSKLPQAPSTATSEEDADQIIAKALAKKNVTKLK